MEPGSAEVAPKVEKPLDVRVRELSEFAKTLPKQTKSYWALDEEEKQKLRKIEDGANKRLRENLATMEESLTSPTFFPVAIDILRSYLNLNGGNYPSHDFREEIAPVIRRNYSSIQEGLDRNKGKGSDVLIRVITDGIVDVDDENIVFVLRNFINGYKESKDTAYERLLNIFERFERENPDTKTAMTGVIVNILNSSIDKETKKGFVDEFICKVRWGKDSKKDEVNFFRERLGLLLEPLGLNVDSMIEAWKSSYLDAGLMIRDIFEENIVNIYDLEKKRPGSARVLNQMFGIRDFMRYPIQMLISQFDKRYDSSTPYGVIMLPRVDYNGAFTDDQKIYLDLFRQMTKLGYAIRVYEGGNKLDLIHAVNSARHTYGKISFALIGGHGSEDTIAFGEEDFSDNVLRIEDLVRKGAPSVSKAFIDNPTIILSSCLTGVEEGIGQTMSNLGATVIAPNRPASISEIKVNVNGESLSFEVKYSEKGKVNKSIPRRYEKGVRV